MIITVDGYDGVGKTSLSKRIEDKYKFKYIEKPFILKHKYTYNCSYETAQKETAEIEKDLFKKNNKEEIIDYYGNALLWINNFKDEANIVLDRGILTLYAVVGEKNNEYKFIELINKGAFFDYSIYLTAQDIERRRRIINNDPNDPDLKYPIEWRKNNLLEFAKSNNLPFYKISTDNKDKDQVFNDASMFLQLLIENQYEKKHNIYVKKLKKY